MRREFRTMAPSMFAGALAALMGPLVSRFVDGFVMQIVLTVVICIPIVVVVSYGWRRHRERSERSPEIRPFEGDVS